jgi:integrase/recombinase XerD
MRKINMKNERVKRKFCRWLREAKGRCDSTVNNIEKVILLYEDYTDHSDFTTYTAERAIEFKEWLKKREFRGKRVSVATYHTYLGHLRKFFTWLSWQPGYRSRITLDAIDFLRPTSKEERLATQYTRRSYPSLEYVRALTDSIEATSEIGLRDRALVSFTLLSGMRDKAIITLPVGCFDEETLTVSQDPRKGVQTKFSKYVPSVLMRFDSKLLGYVVEWVKHLKEKGYGSEDPLFPRSKLYRENDNLSFQAAREVERAFWRETGGIRAIFKRRANEAGLRYYPPHTFRHLCVALALRHCRTGEEIKAVSQNFGHEHIATTLSSYANYSPSALTEILGHIDFAREPSQGDGAKIERIRKILDE